MKYEPQVKKLKSGVEVLVATPGRLLDLHERGDLDLSEVEVLVLDEADRMLDMGFCPTVRRILALPAEGAPEPALLGDLPEDITQPRRHGCSTTRTLHRGRASRATAEGVEQAIMPVAPVTEAGSCSRA